MRERTAAAWEPIGPAVAWLGSRLEPEGSGLAPTAEVVANYFFEFAEPVDGPLVELVSATGAAPNHFQPR